jgi:hypothetical protein
MLPTMSSSEEQAKHEDTSRVGRFIQTYSSFLSSFVIGVAGLVATSIWQYRQSQTALRQAESEQKIAATKAENEWRIARAEILAKNLNILSMQGPSSADQRFGVLLSLTRGAILDPELAVSYALELGKDNASYMGDVLTATEHKNYEQLSQAFKLTCLQRYGVSRDAEICKADKLAERSDAIAEVIHDELDAQSAAPPAPPAEGEPQTSKPTYPGPLSLLRNEREVETNVGKLAWLFEPYLQDLYEKRQWKEIAHFESVSPGAKLVTAIVLATARTGEMMGKAESEDLEKFHAQRRKWLGDFMLGPTCDPECRGKLLDVMLSMYGESDGDYNEAVHRLLLLPRTESGPALGKLHTRLLWCQVDKDDLDLFRDHVLIPIINTALSSPKIDTVLVDDVLGLLAMTDDPKEPPAMDAWNALIATLQKTPEHRDRTFAKLRARVKHERQSPPPMVKKWNFCGAAETGAPTEGE